MKQLYISLCVLIIMISGCGIQQTKDKLGTMQAEDYLIKETKETLKLAITSDIHYLSPKLTDGGQAYETFIQTGDGKQMVYMDAILDAFAYDLARDESDVLIVSGDLTINGEQKSHEDLAEIFRNIEKAGTQVLIIPGNHDLLNPYARGFEGDRQVKVDSVDTAQFEDIYRSFGYEEAVSQDKNSLSYVVPLNEKVWIMMLDTCIYDNNMKQHYPEIDGQLSDESLDWIKACSQKARKAGAKIITVTHQNLLNHSDLINEGFTLRNSDTVRNVFKEEHLLLNLSGHIHVQDIATDFMKPLMSYDIASGALSVYPHQYGKMTINSTTGKLVYETKEVPVEEWARDKDDKDENLRHFDSYKASYFGQYAYDMAIDAYGDNQDLTQDAVETVAIMMERLNLRYFAGREEENATDEEVIKGMKLLEAFPNSFIKPYAKSIRTDPDIEDNYLELDSAMW